MRPLNSREQSAITKKTVKVAHLLDVAGLPLDVTLARALINLATEYLEKGAGMEREEVSEECQRIVFFEKTDTEREEPGAFRLGGRAR